MKYQEDIIFTEFEFSPNYKSWKQVRNKYISIIGDYLLKFSESEINTYFENWLAQINKYLQQEPTKSQMNGLMGFSLLHYFFKDVDQLKNCLGTIYEMFKSKNIEIAKAATQAVYWLSHETPDAVNLLKTPLNMAFKWIANKDSEFYTNALLIIKKAKKFADLEVAQLVVSNHSNVFQLIFNNDIHVKQLAVNIIAFEIKQLAPSSNPSFESTLTTCIKYIGKKDIKKLYGPLLILEKLLGTTPNILLPYYKNLVSDLSTIALSNVDDISITAQNVALGIANSYYDRASINRLFQSFLTKCIKVNPNPLFFKGIKNAIIKFEAESPLKQILECIKSVLQNNNYQICTLAFEVLETTFNYFPNSSGIPPEMYLNMPISQSYINCIKKQNCLTKQIKDYMEKILQRGISVKSNPSSISTSLLISRSFPLQFYGSYEKMLNVLSPLKFYTQELIRIELIKTISVEPIIEAQEFLINFGVFDEFKSVRLAALHYIKPLESISTKSELLFAINDPSFKVRRAVLKLIGELIVFNPFDYSYPLVEYITNVITTVRSHSNIHVISQYASLLPVITTYFCKFIEHLIPTIIDTCLDFLLGEKLTASDKMITADGLNDPDSYLQNLEEREKVEPRKVHIFEVLNERYFVSRDVYLIQTLACLGNKVEPFLERALSAYVCIFSKRKSDKLLTAAVNSLLTLSSKIGTGLNLRLYNKEILQSLLKLLVSDHGNEVSIAVIKLFGTAFDSISTSEVEATSQSELGVDLNSKSFYTDYTISHLIPYFQNPTMQLFNAVSKIYELAPKDAAKFVDLVIPMFIKGIDTFVDKYKDMLFSCLEVITCQCQIESFQFLQQITEAQLKYLNLTSSIKLAASLSFHFMSGYKKYISILYYPCTKMLTNPNRNYFKYLMKLFTFSILYQDQSFDVFLRAIEQRIKSNMTPILYKYVCDSLICLVQTKDLSEYQSRLFIISLHLLRNEQAKPYVVSFLPSLYLYANLPIDLLKQVNNNFNLSLACLNNSEFKPKCVIPKISLYHPIIPSSTIPEDIFSSLSDPDELTISKWLDELCQKVIDNSPSMVIRSCSGLATTITTFRQQIFPIAFLSCWQNTIVDERIYFSEIVERVLTNFKHIDPFFISIIELTDRAFIPLFIDDLKLADACGSGPLSLFFLQRLFINGSRDPVIVEKLLGLNAIMGRQDAVHGVLVRVEGVLDASKTAFWSELLGEWDKALELYDDNPEDLPSKIRCYAHLEMWDKVLEHEKLYDHWSDEMKERNAKNFAWANYHIGNFEKVDEYIQKFHREKHLSEILFLAFYSLKNGKYDECQEIINNGFNLLAKDANSFTGGNAMRLHKNLHYSHMFIELQESLDILRNGNIQSKHLTEIWNKRLKGFQRDSKSWLRLISIRSLVLAPGENIDVYLKMISVLRKERRWNLIDSYFDRLFSQTFLPNVELAKSKMLWSRGKKEEAIETLESILEVINLQKSTDENTKSKLIYKINPEKFNISTLIRQKSAYDLFNIKEPLENLSPETTKNRIIDAYNKHPQEVNNYIKKMFDNITLDRNLESRIYKTLGNYRFDAEEHTPENLKEIAQLFEIGKIKNNNDYKIWLGWAVVNSCLIDVSPTNNDQYSINAITGFLKATQLKTANTLEYLSQLFSIFFRMKDISTINSTLISDLIALPPHIIDQVIPQITVQIAHEIPSIRQVVHKILYNFGKKHFQAIFYPLRLYESCEDQKVTIAKELLLNLGKKHSEVAADAELFVDGMLRAAISWFEQWIFALDQASRYYQNEQYDKMDEILNKQFQHYNSPKCDFDRLFIKLYDNLIQQCRANFKAHNHYSIVKMWDQFKHLFGLMVDRVKKLELILLPKVSEALAIKRNFKIVIPGTYSVDREVPTLYSIEPALQVLSTQQHPRCIFMNSSTNEKVKFLLKGNEDIRLDQRVMQFFGLINTLLNHNVSIRDVGAQIVRYAIIPLAPNAGLITWVTGADTLHQLISEQRFLQCVSQSIELDIQAQITGNIGSQLSTIQKLEIFENIVDDCDANEIREILWGRSTSAASWLSKNMNFTVTTALISIVGYIIGLCDRHPSNIMVQRETGKVIHIDFGDSFEVAIFRKVYPEKVPFRLTRMIVNALDGGTVEGIFRKTCEDVLWILRESRDSIVALLEIFVHEPLEETEEAEGKNKSQTKIIDRVSDKLQGKDYLLPNYEEGKYLDVESNVDALIQQAMDPYRYISHYAGWCPYW